MARGSRLTLRPKTRISPDVIGDTQEIMRTVVVFPAPLGPRNPQHSPSRTTNSMLSTARVSPNVFTKRLASMTGGPGSLRVIARDYSPRGTKTQRAEPLGRDQIHIRQPPKCRRAPLRAACAKLPPSCVRFTTPGRARAAGPPRVRFTAPARVRAAGSALLRLTAPARVRAAAPGAPSAGVLQDRPLSAAQPPRIMRSRPPQGAREGLLSGSQRTP